jgi:hypothetical protein
VLSTLEEETSNVALPKVCGQYIAPLKTKRILEKKKRFSMFFFDRFEIAESKY